MRQLPMRDQIGAYRRKIVSARHFGLDAACSCGEKRPEALIPGTKPATCAACQRTALGQTIMDKHHFAGRANNPATIPVPVNDHRARLSVAQSDWPKPTLINAQGSPLLAAAGCVRGFIDVIHYLIEKGLLWIADMLEVLDEFQVKKLGPQWWIDTELEQFCPKRKFNDKS